MELFNNKKFDDENAGFGKEPKPVIFHSIEYTIDSICKKILDIDNLDRNEIRHIILNQYHMILDYDLFLSSEESRKCAQILFTNETFLALLNEEILLLNLTNDQIICVNKLAYDYYVIADCDIKISNLLLSITYQVNSDIVNKLSIKIGINNARILAMISRSSFKIEKNVHRVNTFFMRCSMYLSIQNIVDIICIVYDKFTYPFIYTMLEGISQDVYMSLSETQKTVYKNISKALLYILMSLQDEDIKYVLTQYGYTLKMLPNNNVIRFPLKNIKDDRIISIIDDIESGDYNDIKII